MNALRPITTGDYAVIETPRSFGRPQQLKWLPISALGVDPEYQRDITLVGRKNVRHIAERFSWSMFTPVVVAPVGGDKFAIVDGQHRTTAAKLCGIEKVPCAIIEAVRGEQAAAFRAINGNTTRLHTCQIYHAALAAKEDWALRMAEAVAAAGVVVARTAGRMVVPNSTMTVTRITKAIERFGAQTTALGLRAIVAAGNDEPFRVLNSIIIWGTVEVLSDHRDWCKDEKRLVAAFEMVDLEEMRQEAASAASKTAGTSTRDQFESRLVAALAAHFAPAKPKRRA